MIVIVSRTEGEGHGAEMVLQHLLANYHDKAKLIVLTAKDSSIHNTCKKNQIKVFAVSFIANRILPNFFTIEKILPTLKIADSIHAWQAKSFEISWYISKRLGKPLTCTVHDHPKANIFSTKKQWLLKKIANSASKTIAVSYALRAHCLNHGYKRIQVINNGLPDIEHDKLKEFNSPITTIGFLGMYAYWKGFSVICNWIKECKNYENIRWYLYGNLCESNIPHLKDLQQSGIGNFIVKGQKDPVTIFSEINILVSASTQFDPFPTVLLEAARAGVVAISNTNGGAKEIIRNNVTGFIFDESKPDDGLSCLQKVISDRKLREVLSFNARQRFIDKFTVEKMVSGYDNFWNNTRRYK